MIMIAYYAITAFLLGLLGWNFVREKSRRGDLALYLLVMVPLRPQTAQVEVSQAGMRKDALSQDGPGRRRSSASSSGAACRFPSSALRRPDRQGPGRHGRPSAERLFARSQGHARRYDYLCPPGPRAGRQGPAHGRHPFERAGGHALGASSSSRTASSRKGPSTSSPSSTTAAAGTPGRATAIRSISTSPRTGASGASASATATPRPSTNGPTRMSTSTTPNASSSPTSTSATPTGPGRAGPDGPLMERVTFGAMELMRREKIDVAIDVHGAETMFPVTNCIVAPESSVKIATLASLTVKAKEGLREPRRAVAGGLPRPVPPGDRRPRPVAALPARGAHPLPRPADRTEDDQAPPRRQGPLPPQPVQEEEALRPLRRERLAAREEGRPEPVRDPGDLPPVLEKGRRPGHRRHRRPPLCRPRQERRRALSRRPVQGPGGRGRHELSGAGPAAPPLEVFAMFKEKAIPAILVLAAVLVLSGGVSLAPRGRSRPVIRPRPGLRGVHRHHGRPGRVDRRLGHEHPRGRLRRLRLHLAPRPRRRPQAGRKAEALQHRPDPHLAARRGRQVGHGPQGPDRRRDPRGAPHLRLPSRRLRLHERPAAGHRRIDDRQRAQAQQPDADPGDEHHHADASGHGALPDGPRGHQAHGLARRGVRLRLSRRRRDAGRLRPQGDLGLRDHARRPALDAEERQAGSGLGGPARPGRPGRSLHERIRHRRDRPRQPGLLHGLGPRRVLRRRGGSLRPQGRQAVQLEEGLFPDRRERREHGRPPLADLALLRPRRAVEEVQARDRPTWTSPSRSSPTPSSRPRTSWP